MPSTTITLSSGVSYAPYGTLTVNETATSSADNTSTVTAVLVLHRPYSVSSTATKTASMTINGTTYSWSGTIGGSGDLTLLSRTITITHDSDGSKTINISATIQLAVTWSGTYIDSISNSGSLTLTKLDRYPSASCSLKSKTETTLTVKWSSDSTITKVEYSKNGGSSYTTYTTNANAKSGSFTISSLSANTSYSVKVRLTSKTSSLATASSAVSMKTYNWPYCSALVNFTIGGKWGFTLYNPLNRTVTLRMFDNNGGVVGDDDEFTGTTFEGYMGTEINDALYASIPNSKTGSYSLRVTYGTHVSTKTGGVYSVNETDCKPSITTLTYADSNAVTQAIVGDTSKIVQNLGTPVYTASGLVTKNYATVSTVNVAVNGDTQSLTVSGTTATGGSNVINSATDVTAIATITDSRGITATKTVTVQMLAYTTPSAIVTVQREYNYYDETDITVATTVSSLNGGNSATIQYRTKKTTDTDYGGYTTIQNGVTATAVLDNQYAWNVQILITDTAGGSTTINKSVRKGIPQVFFDFLRNSVGFNTIPANDNAVEVAGSIYEGGTALSDKYILIRNSTVTDLDDAQTTGFYYYTSSASNVPTSAGGTLMVVRTSETYIHQVAFCNSAATSSTRKSVIYARFLNSTGWSNWSQITL